MEKKKKNQVRVNNVKKTTKKNSNNTVKKKVTKNSLLEDKVFKLAEKYLKNKEYDNAYKEFLKLSEKYPKNKKIYKRLIESLTHNYTYKEKSRDFKMALDDYITTYKILATKKEIKFFEKKLLEYKSVKVSGSKSKFLLIFFLGIFGVHKFIEKKYIMGVIYLCTLGIFGIGVILDLIDDYAEYEDDFGLNIIRYLISILVLIFSLFRLNTPNYFYFILIAIILTPIVYSKILKLIPGIIKIIGVLVLCYFGFRIEPVVYYVPNNIIGEWVTENESTNITSIKIKQDKSTINFSDRDDETGLNEYDNTNKVLSIYVNATNVYKFRIDLENEELCTYTDHKKCIISFKKPVEEK